MAEKQSTIWIKAYLPEGHQVGITLAFDGIENLPEASALQSAILAKGYVLDIPENEKIEVMSHISRRTHVDKETGEKTAMLAFYHENVKLNFKYDHMYMNTDEQIAEFESLSGMKMMDIPELKSKTWLDRTDYEAKDYIVPLPKRIRVAAALKPYKTVDGKEGETWKIQRFVGSGESTPPAKVWNKGEMAEFWRDWNGSKGIEDTVILKALGVSKLSEWTHSLELANERMGLATAS